MTSTQIQEEISREVARLPLTEEQEVLRFVRFLRTRNDLPESEFGRLLRSFFEDLLWRPRDSELLAAVLESPGTIPVEINKTEGVNGGAASIGASRIAVWMLEEAKRAGFRDGEILAMYPQLDARHLVLAWWYVAANGEEIELDIQNND